MCADICACNDKKCPSRTLCYRFTCKKGVWQGYFAESPRKKGQIGCEMFWDNSAKIWLRREGKARLVKLSQKDTSFCDKQRPPKEALKPKINNKASKKGRYKNENN